MVRTLWTSLLFSFYVLSWNLNLYQTSDFQFQTYGLQIGVGHLGKGWIEIFLTPRHNPGSSSQILLSRADKSKWDPDKSIVTEISTFCGAHGAQFGFCSTIHESRSKRVPMTGVLIIQPLLNYQHSASQKMPWSLLSKIKYFHPFLSIYY